MVPVCYNVDMEMKRTMKRTRKPAKVQIRFLVLGKPVLEFSIAGPIAILKERGKS